MRICVSGQLFSRENNKVAGNYATAAIIVWAMQVSNIPQPSSTSAMSTGNQHPTLNRSSTAPCYVSITYTPIPHLGALSTIPIRHPEIIPAQGNVMNHPM
jgi:hypothetical protein